MKQSERLPAAHQLRFTYNLKNAILYTSNFSTKTGKMTLLKMTMAALAATVISTLSFAQQKQLTDDQYFKGNFKGIVQPLPTALRWSDNTHFLLLRDGKTFVEDAKAGTEREATDADKNVAKINPKPAPYIKDRDIYYKDVDVEVRLTNDTLTEVNPTVSPDGKFIRLHKKE